MRQKIRENLLTANLDLRVSSNVMRRVGDRNVTGSWIDRGAIGWSLWVKRRQNQLGVSSWLHFSWPSRSRDILLPTRRRGCFNHDFYWLPWCQNAAITLSHRGCLLYRPQGAGYCIETSGLPIKIIIRRYPIRGVWSEISLERLDQEG